MKIPFQEKIILLVGRSDPDMFSEYDGTLENYDGNSLCIFLINVY